ncbi:unnamed protein product [Clavelina lepadiformis]|uniref:LITAF domain-containing protein n=1 Tax=Clavelina lepadiformis TaxID=159417 RepID=A0ABP0GJ64_CLALP
MDQKNTSPTSYGPCETTPNVETNFATSDPQPAVAQVTTQDQVGQQQVVVQIPVLGKHPEEMICSSCHETVVTKTKKKLKSSAWVSVANVCAIGLIFFWIPLVIPSNYKTVHTCPMCKNKIGVYKA